MSVTDVIKKFKKEYKDENLFTTADITPTYERLASGALGMDYPLYGGLPLGRICIYSGLQHSGKAQPLDALVLAESGYIRMGDISVGTSVYGADGTLHRVDGVFPQGIKPIYKVTFNDNTSTECSDEHLWTFLTASGECKTMELRTLLNKPLQDPKTQSYLYKIPMTAAVQFKGKSVSIDPYLLGCLLGDGSLHATHTSISSIDADILLNIQKILQADFNYKLIKINDSCTYNIVPQTWEHRSYSGYYYEITYKGITYKGVGKALLDAVSKDYPKVTRLNTLRTICRNLYQKKSTVYKVPEYNAVSSALSVHANPEKTAPTSRDRLAQKIKDLKLNVTSEYKFIPETYLINDIETRLAVLQGLFDTDGYVTKSGELEYTSVSKKLVDDVAFIIESLGGRCTRKSGVGKYKDKHGKLHICKPTYTLYNIKLPENIMPFRCSRKIDRRNTKLNNKERRFNLRAITKIEYLRDDYCQCIHLDSADHLYLTNNCIVTHNTTAACCELAAYQRKFPDKVCFYVDVEHSLDLKFQARMNGIDLSKLQYVNPNGLSGEQICDLIVELQKEDDIGMIVLDSLPAMLPAIVMESDMTKDAGMRGTMAKKLYPFLAAMASMVNEKNNVLILINQVRQTGTTFTGAPIYKEPCGSAPQYYSSVSVRFGTRKFTKGDDMDACKTTNGEGADGFRLQFKVTKNKTAACARGGGFITYRYDKGLDWVNDLLEIALSFNFIERINNVTYALKDLYTGEVLKDEDGNDLIGKKNYLIEYIKTNIPFQTKYLAMLNKYISEAGDSYGSLLDERASKEIEQQENLVEHQFDQVKE